MNSPVNTIDRPELLDPLEDILSLTGARARLTARLVGHGDWALLFAAPPGAKFNAVLEGTCTLTVDGHPPLTLRAGDIFLLTRPVDYALATSPTVDVQPAAPYFRPTPAEAAVVGSPTEPVTAGLVGGSFEFDGRARQLLLDGLPPVIHLPGHAEGALSTQQMLTRIDRELRHDRLGSRVVAEQFALVMLIDLLRYHISVGAAGRSWIYGLAEPVTATALRAMHADPARHWTVQQLAEAAHVSRSTLAVRFKQAVGQGPLEYLTRWRLELGADRLAKTDQGIAAIARAVGYGSEGAFSLAFKRMTGQAPGAYRRHTRGHPDDAT
ncbi:AraC family transcriptional regulator [Amycolatopsis rhabdoformis]|uniref:AraC family transcriptional regulator n=1 Tax=Amycolatopsis rhabdoformis TaxID=1448059 RepID=A0ABZ1ICB7_9PSEU|nr:AraC family transcriptional regulator [Amycolatopsis rhabdoformis]WSE32114.1 AraC family transcriptional regulator [Amycolatopsis rhabdoformis]